MNMDNETTPLSQDQNKNKKNNYPLWRLIYNETCDWAETFTLALALLITVFLFLVRYVTVDGTSMTNTLQDHDRLIIANAYGNYKTGDIVVVRVPGHDKPLIKRVIATEGQTVEIDFDNWIVKVDGVPLDEPYVRNCDGKKMHYWQYYDGPITVGEGKMFVMGDNRNGSSDSRNPEIGQIDVRRTLGKLLIRFFPLDGFGTVD